MATCGFDRLPTELLDHVIELLDRPELFAFRATCKRVEKCTHELFIDYFPTTHRTTLMGSSLERLDGISKHPKLNAYVKHIHIQDDLSYFDPWCASPAPRDPPHIWRRTETGLTDTASLGITTLRAMLSESRVRPETITVRDHRINSSNIHLCDPAIQSAFPFSFSTDWKWCGAAAFLAGDILRDLDMAILSAEERDVTCAIPKTGTVEGLAQPRVYHISVAFSPDHQGTGSGLGLTRSVRTSVSPGSWVWDVARNAPRLETFSSHWKHQNPAAPPVLASRGLTTLTLSSAAWTASQVLSLVQNSKSTLTSIDLNNVHVQRPSSWRELLSLLSTSFPSLKNFRVMHFLELNDEGHLVGMDFPRLTMQDFPEECRAGLKLYRVHAMNMIKWVDYEGDAAGEVLGILAEWMSVRNEWSNMRRVCIHR